MSIKHEVYMLYIQIKYSAYFFLYNIAIKL